jgi:hypothetical protein
MAVVAFVPAQEQDVASITIPAAYVEDARLACLANVREDGVRLEEADEIDRSSGAIMLTRNTRLLEQLLDASSDLTVLAEHDHTSSPITEMLEALIRHVVGRLDRECVYCPLPTGEMLHLVAELQWAAGEAVRICPALDSQS